MPNTPPILCLSISLLYPGLLEVSQGVLMMNILDKQEHCLGSIALQIKKSEIQISNRSKQ